MDKVRTVIIDDEVAAIDYLVKLCEQLSPEMEVVGTASGIAEAIELIRKEKPVVVFVDIEFPEGLGFEILSAFPDAHFQVVFVTAYDHYSLQAIKFNALDYLLKPVDASDFAAVVERILSRLDRESKLSGAEVSHLLQVSLKANIALPTQTGQEFIAIDGILRVEADGSYSKVFTTEGPSYLVSKSLVSFDQVLVKRGFVRVHRKHLINPEHIASVLKNAGGSVVMRDKSELPLSRSGKELLQQRLKEMSEFL